MMASESPISDSDSWHPATRLVQGGIERSAFGETAEALFLTSGFVYDSAEQAEATFTGAVKHYQYSRIANPTITMLERMVPPRTSSVAGRKGRGGRDLDMRRDTLAPFGATTAASGPLNGAGGDGSPPTAV